MESESKFNIHELPAPKQPIIRQIVKKSNKPSLKHSNFFMVINTNKNMQTISQEEGEALKEKFKLMTKKLFVELDNRFLQMQGSKEGTEYGWPKEAPRQELWKRVEGKPKIQYSFEIGPKSGKLHLNILFAISKRGLDTKLDYTGIREWIDQEMGFTCHFKNKMFRDARADLFDYIAKDPVD